MAERSPADVNPVASDDDLGPTPREHLNWLIKINQRPGSIKQREHALRRLTVHIAPVKVLDATTADLDGFVHRIATSGPGRGERQLSPESRATEISHLRGFYKWALREELITTDPSARLVRPRLPRHLPRPIPTGDLVRAIEQAPDRQRMILWLAAHAGLRACEIAPLRVEHVDLRSVPPMIMVEVSKGGGMSSVPISPALAAVLDELLPNEGWLFPREDGQPGPKPAWRISQIANKYLHDLGLPNTLHTLRHWFGTSFYQASGRDLRATQEAMRHTNPTSTARYTWVDPGDLVRTVAALPTLT